MLSRQLQQRFMLARPWFALIATYAVSLMLAALSMHLTSGREALDYQAAFFATSVSVVLLWVALLLFRPKPSKPAPRTVYALFEYLLVALVLSLALILVFHRGWHLGTEAPAGFAAIAWGVAWIGAWLGPVVIGVLTLLGAHWLWLTVFIDYRSACWKFVEDARTDVLLKDLVADIQDQAFLRPRDAEYVGRKLIHWHSTAAWKPFELPLPSTGVHLHGYFKVSDDTSGEVLVLSKRPAQHDETVLQSIVVKWPVEPTTL